MGEVKAKGEWHPPKRVEYKRRADGKIQSYPPNPRWEEIPCEGILTDGSHCTRQAMKKGYLCWSCRQAKEREKTNNKFTPNGMEHWREFIKRGDPLSLYEEMEALRGVLAQVLEVTKSGEFDSVVVKSIVQLSENVRRCVVTMAEAREKKKQTLTEEQAMRLKEAFREAIVDNVEDQQTKVNILRQFYGSIFTDPQYQGLQQIESGWGGRAAASGEDVPEDAGGNPQ